MENINEAIAQSETDLIATRGELRTARELVASLEQDAKQIELELVGLRSYARRRGLSAVAPDANGSVVPISPGVTLPAEPDTALLSMSRTEAVATIMSQAPGAMDRNEIHEQIALSGRDDSIDEISLSLTGLKRAGKVEKLGRGLWQMVDPTTATGS